MRTPYPGISRLLPSQIYNLTEKIAVLRPLLIDHFPEQTSDSYTSFCHYFEHSIKELSRVFSDKTIEIALTGRRDSRALVPLAEKSGIDYNTFTFWHSHISEADIVIPTKIAKKLGRKHRLIKRISCNYSEERRPEYQLHTAGMAVDEDWEFFSYGQYQQLKKGEKLL